MKGKKVHQKNSRKQRARSKENAEKVEAQAKSLEEQAVEAKAQAERLRGLLRDKQTLQMARFPEPIEHLGSTTAKVEVSGRYAEVRFKLRDLADELANSNANIVLAVLE